MPRFITELKSGSDSESSDSDLDSDSESSDSDWDSVSSDSDPDLGNLCFPLQLITTISWNVFSEGAI